MRNNVMVMRQAGTTSIPPHRPESDFQG